MQYATAYLLLSQAPKWFNRGFTEGNEAATTNWASFFLRPAAAAAEAEREEEEEEEGAAARGDAMSIGDRGETDDIGDQLQNLDVHDDEGAQASHLLPTNGTYQNT